jgi:glycosyltransferase involved in cell wall biosynthesis
VTSYRIAFVLEQALGHATHARNLQRHVSREPDIRACWAPIPWETRGVASHLPIYRSNWTVRAGIRARRAIGGMAARARLDALFFHTQVPAVLARKWIRRVPSIVSLDATPLQYDALGEHYGHGVGPAWVEHLKWRLHRECFRAARGLVAWSEWAKRGLTTEYGVPAEKVSVIPPGVDVGDWARPIPRRHHSDPVKILFVGADLNRKGGPLLLEAFRTVRALGAELHVVTPGPVPSEPGVFVHTAMEPNSPALRALYHESDVFCLPTFADCLPIALAEAGAAGLPLVATDVAGIREIVEDGATGLLVPVGDARALAAALGALIGNPELRLEQGARAAAVVARKFSAERNAMRVLELLRRECAPERAARPTA